jgi:hypothetical protein
MSFKQLVLGTQSDRVKVDIRFPESLWSYLGRICERLGVPKNAFVVLAVCEKLVEYGPVLNRKNYKFFLERVENLLETVRANLKDYQ